MSRRSFLKRFIRSSGGELSYWRIRGTKGLTRRAIQFIEISLMNSSLSPIFKRIRNLFEIWDQKFTVTHCGDFGECSWETRSALMEVENWNFNQSARVVLLRADNFFTLWVSEGSLVNSLDYWHCSHCSLCCPTSSAKSRVLFLMDGLSSIEYIPRTGVSAEVSCVNTFSLFASLISWIVPYIIYTRA